MQQQGFRWSQQMDERVSIRDNTKPLRKYGSISSNTNFTRNEHQCIKHVVTQTDTLQGLALKYSVTVIILFCLFFFNRSFIPGRYNAHKVVFLRLCCPLHTKRWSVSESYFSFPIHFVICNMSITRISKLNLNPL